MARNNNRQQRPRSNMPRQRSEHYASFGFRHSLITANPGLYGWLASIQEEIDKKDIKARLHDPSKFSLKVIERMRVTLESQRHRYKISRSEIGAVKQEVSRNLGGIGLTKSGITLEYDRLVVVGSAQRDADRRKLALAPSPGHAGTELLFEEHEICRTAMRNRGMPEIRYPDSDWVPHETAVVINGDPADVIGLVDEHFKNYTAEHGPVTARYSPLEYYAETSESMV